MVKTVETDPALLTVRARVAPSLLSTTYASGCAVLLLVQVSTLPWKPRR